MKKSILITAAIIISTNLAFSQGTAINSNGAPADNSAMLDVSSTSAGFALPRMTTAERNSIASPTESLLIFNTDTKCFEAYVNGGWYSLGCPAPCTPPAAPVANAASALACTAFTANWSASVGATSYYLDVSTNPGFTSFAAGYNNLNIGNVISYNVSGLTSNTTYYYRLRAVTACVSTNSNTITAVTISAPDTAGLISGTSLVCQNQNGIAFSVGGISGATSYTWTYSGSGFNCVSGCTTNSITANFSGTATSGYLNVYGSNSCGNGVGSANYDIVVNATPTIASAGSDIYLSCCATSATLNANTPSAGTGVWTVVSGTASITTPSSPTSDVTGLAVPGTATLRWTISNPPCAPSTDDVVIYSCFTCGCPWTDARDGKKYNTILKNSQCWMAENLNYSTSGVYTPVASGQGAAGTQKYCYGDAESACNTYGGLYEWAEVMNGSSGCNGTGAPPNDKCATPVQGICPAGWHIPSHYEWTTLEKNVGGSPGSFPYDLTTSGWLGTYEGDNLKTTGNGSPPLWKSPSAGTNSSSFTSLPSGLAWTSAFNYIGEIQIWWSSYAKDGTNAWLRRLQFDYNNVCRYYENMGYGFSVRCIKD